MKGERIGDWLLLNLPAIAENRDENGQPIEDPLGRALGEPLWPDRYDAEELRRIRRDMGERAFAALYQQRPRPLEGVLWKEDWIENGRWKPSWGEFDINICRRIVIGVDPTGSVTGDECGIVASGVGWPDQPCPCGADPDESPLPHGYVLEDGSGHFTPKGWAKRTSWLYRSWDADAVVVERNFGGDLVVSNLRSADIELPIKDVNASKGKAVRAEPVANLYQLGRMHHIGNFPELEAEQLSWQPDSRWSPNRLDGLVWGATDLQLTARRARLLAAK